MPVKFRIASSRSTRCASSHAFLLFCARSLRKANVSGSTIWSESFGLERWCI